MRRDRYIPIARFRTTVSAAVSAIELTSETWKPTALPISQKATIARIEISSDTAIPCMVGSGLHRPCPQPGRPPPNGGGSACARILHAHVAVRGFEDLVSTVRELRLPLQLRPPAPAPRELVEALGQPLDAELAAIYREHANGGRIGELLLYPVRESAQDLAFSNTSARSVPELDPRIHDVILFSQLGFQATHLATVPGAGTPEGTQPVVFVDINESWLALPVASSVDAAFRLLARYLELLAARSGVEAGLLEVLFPWDVPELVARDRELRQQIAAGAFDQLLERSDPETATWLARVAHEPT